MKSVKPRRRTFQKEKKNYSIRFPSDLYDYFKKVADESGKGVADIISDVLDETATDWITEEKNKRNKASA